MIVQFFIVFKDYLIEVLPSLAIGFLLSSLVHEFVPTGWVERRLGGKGIKPLLYSTLVGTALPICCYGSLPVAKSEYKGKTYYSCCLACQAAFEKEPRRFLKAS